MMSPRIYFRIHEVPTQDHKENNMDLESKVSALKDFASFGSSSKSGLSSSRNNHSNQNTNSSSQNGWGNWFAKGEKDPILPSLVSLSYVINMLMSSLGQLLKLYIFFISSKSEQFIER